MHNKLEYFVLSDDIKKVYIAGGIPEHKIKVVHNGASELIKYNEVPKYSDRALYLAKIDYRKRQYLFQSIPFLYFAGNIADGRFKRSDRYLGEWTREQVLNDLGDYCTLVLLSDGEADPLTVKEGLMAGCGIVVSEYACANIDLSKKWITVVPENKVGNIEYVKKAIHDNMQYVKNPEIRMEIRKYAVDKFSWDNIIWNNYLKNAKKII